MRKVVLSLLLIFPVLIYFFLKIFGTNQYDVNIYYEEGIDLVMLPCSKPKGQHFVTIPSYVPGIDANQIKVFSIVKEEVKNSNALVNELVRIKEAFLDFPQVSTISLSSHQYNSLFTENYISEEYVDTQIVLEDTLLMSILNCELIVPYPINDTMDIVLVDNKQRIRGYYDIDNEESIDRLILEVNILLQQN